jgi:hypothetical protein
MSNKYNDVSSIGYKYTHQEGDYKCYLKFNKINNIRLKINPHDSFLIEHDRAFPDKSLIDNKINEFTSENKDTNTVIDKISTWIIDCAQDEDEEFKDEDTDNDDNTSINIPEVEHDSSRTLFIVVWGRGIRKAIPSEYKIEKNFNAGVLHGKKSGVNWRHSAKEDDDVFKAVMCGKAFPTFMESMVKNIEKNNLHRIGINCTKGRHRSVSCARALQKYYYPNTEIKYLELK